MHHRTLLATLFATVMAAATPSLLSGATATTGRATTTAPAVAPAATPAPAGAALALSAAELANASATIDRLVGAALAENRVKANPAISDEQFLRRAYLQIIGRIPTQAEATAFLSTASSGKRAKLIASLLASEGHVSRQFTWWADLLRAETRLMDRYPGQPYLDWIKQSLRENKPYDRMVSELILAEGPAMERGNGATGYYLRDAGMQQDNMANTVQLFLGTQVTCAQCHDHPSDVWTRRDFFEMAAYTSGTAVDRRPPGEPRKPAGKGEARGERGMLKQQLEQVSPEVRNAFRNLGYGVTLKVNDSDKRTIGLPSDYQYADGKPGEAVRPHALFGDAATVGPKDEPRQVYARWLTSPENPRFTLVIANRLWKQVMGLGLIEPVDNLTESTRASHPELMVFLTRLMVTVKYDLRRYQQILYQTETWQRAATREDLAPGAVYHFQGPLLRRLTAEQVWDSLITLAVADPEALKGADAGPQHEFYEQNKDKSANDLLAMATVMVESRQKGKELQKEFRELQAKARQATPAERPALREQMRAMGERRKELEEAGMGMGRYGAANAAKGKQTLLRASELPAPAPPGHFLRTFGQSDRELIANASDAPTVTQALALLNGFIDKELLGKKTPLADALTQAADAPSAVRTAFLCILSREPTARELGMAVGALGADGKAARDDLAWALLNTHEFLFLQ